MWIIVMITTALSLRLNFDHRLKILQLTDLHFGEGQDDQTQELIFSMVSTAKADLVVISGDMVSGNLEGVSFSEVHLISIRDGKKPPGP
jgi:predicted MPP superfamily phosphohydrolase